MILLNPKKYNIKHSDKCFQQIILKTIDFFENKGLKKVKDDDQKAFYIIKTASKTFGRFTYILSKISM